MKKLFLLSQDVNRAELIIHQSWEEVMLMFFVTYIAKFTVMCDLLQEEKSALRSVQILFSYVHILLSLNLLSQKMCKITSLAFYLYIFSNYVTKLLTVDF